MFFPVNRRVRITDGMAAATAQAPGTLVDLTRWWRSGGDISVAQVTAMRGVANRGSDEYLYVRRQTPSISDVTFEEDDAAGGPVQTIDMADVRHEQQRAWQVEYESAHTRTIACLVSSVGDSFQESDVMLYPVGLQASGAMAEAGF